MDQTRQTETTCPYCGVGCGVSATTGSGKLTAVTGAALHPSNLGRLCIKGSTLHKTSGEARLRYPQVRGCRTNWRTALDVVSAGFLETIERHGPESVAFYLSGQLLTEDYYVANKLMKGFIGSANVDTNSRLCMASAVAGYKRAFGADVVPCCYEDLECCDLLVLVGSNAAWTHPVLYQRIVAARAARPQMKVVIIDPRRTATCDLADLHLAVAPGSDGFLFSALLRFLSDRQCLNQRFIDMHTEGFQEALDDSCTLDQAVAATGLDQGEIEQFFRWFARTEATVTFYSQGINQSATGTDKCNAIINCHLATARIGKPGTGPFSITGQPNAMGGREVGGLANVLASHMDFSGENVERVGRFWQAERMVQGPGLKAVEMFNAIERGEIRAIWIMATNPVVSLPDSERIRRALGKCELVVVSDCVESTDTTALAHVLLPAAGWGEKDGTVTNSERRISRQRAILPPSGEARPDWRILCDVANRMGFGRHFAYRTPADIFREHAALSGFENSAAAPRAFNIAGLAQLSDSDYEQLAPIQWPVPDRRSSGTARLFGDGQFFTASRRARFVVGQPQLPARKDARPFVLNSGRIRDQWHTMTRTGHTAGLLAHIDRPFLAMSPRDACAAGIVDGDLLQVSNEQGDLLLQVKVDAGQRDGEVFAPIHWNDQFASRARVSTLFRSVTDPVSGQPESKFSTVTLLRVKVGGWAHIISRTRLPLEQFSYWTVSPADEGWRHLFALPPDMTRDDFLHWLESLSTGLQRIELHGETGYRGIFCSETQIMLGVYLAADFGALPSPRQLAALLQHEPGADTGRLLVQQTNADTERLICSCHQVTLGSIQAALEAGAADAGELGRSLRCGTQCGTCLPELRRLVNEHRESPVAVPDPVR